MPSASSAASIGGSTMSTPSGMSATPSARRIAAISRAAPRNRPASGATAPRSPIIPAWMFSGAQPRAVQPVVLGGRAEVPDVRLAAAGQQRVAGHLVARPLADVGARDVADVVEVEQQDARRGPTRRAPSRARPSRYVRSRSTFQRSSQSTFIEPGEAIGRACASDRRHGRRGDLGGRHGSTILLSTVGVLRWRATLTRPSVSLYVVQHRCTVRRACVQPGVEEPSW